MAQTAATQTSEFAGFLKPAGRELAKEASVFRHPVPHPSYPAGYQRAGAPHVTSKPTAGGCLSWPEADHLGRSRAQDDQPTRSRLSPWSRLRSFAPTPATMFPCSVSRSLRRSLSRSTPPLCTALPRLRCG